MFELFTEACFVMYLVTQHMFDNVVNVPNKLQFMKRQAQSQTLADQHSCFIQKETFPEKSNLFYCDSLFALQQF